MPQQQPTEGFSGFFNQQFGGLDLSKSGAGLASGLSPVFHNCEVDSTGAVTRRGGTNVVSTVAPLANGKVWSGTLKTKRGSEFLISVSSDTLFVELFTTVGNKLVPLYSWNKPVPWLRSLEEVHFLAVSAPYDRLIIFSANHPPIQVSILERTLPFTCINVGLQRVTSPFATTDSPLWYDSGATPYTMVDYNLPIPANYAVNSRSGSGFDYNITGAGMALNEVRNLTIIQVTWQWWAESLYWQGKDFSQTVSRLNVTDLDQNVKIPLDLITDLDPRFVNSPYIGITVATSSNVCVAGAMTTPTNAPATDTTWGHSVGVRYIQAAAGTELNHAPFFVTYGSKLASAAPTSITIVRQRELRFNAGTGVAGNNLHVYVNGVLRSGWLSGCGTTGRDDYVLFKDITSGSIRVRTNASNFTSKSTGISFENYGNVMDYGADIIMTNKETKWVSNGQAIWYKSLTAAGGSIDGTYVPVPGLGLFCDYEKGTFPYFGTLYRDRIVLRLPNESSDQLLVSGTGDEVIPGEFYTYYQVTDALEGVTDDPFTINVTTKSREKITALLGWQQSLFVFTGITTYGIQGGEAFGPDGFSIGLVAAYGAFNNRSVAATNLTVLFMNRYGVFDLMAKNNTSDYGSFERSVPIRRYFEQSPASETSDGLAWLTFNDANNKVYIGLPSPTDTLYCSRMLQLNLAWNAWSTISSALPFQASVAVQLFNWTILLCKTDNFRLVFVLQMDAPHYVDFYTRMFGAALPVTVSFPFLRATSTVDSRNIVTVPTPTTPGIVEFKIPNTSKVANTYISNNGLANAFRPRNYMMDIPGLRPLLPPGPPSDLGEMVLINSFESSPIYFNPTTYVTGTGSITLPIVTAPNGTDYASVTGFGMNYLSVYASPVFNLSMLGRLKRLKRLHLLFDTTAPQGVDYQGIGEIGFNSYCKNSALISVVSAYNTGEQVITPELLGYTTSLDSIRLDTPNEAYRRKELSMPLQGYGVDYQFFITSTGVETFKLLSYELDIQPQGVKRYVQ